MTMSLHTMTHVEETTFIAADKSDDDKAHWVELRGEDSELALFINDPTDIDRLIAALMTLRKMQA